MSRVHARCLRISVDALFLIVLLFAPTARRVEAACPEGTTVAIHSATGALGTPLVFSFRGAPPATGSFSIVGATENNSGALAAGRWLQPLGDLDGDGRTEYRLDVPGTGPGGWGDSQTNGCPATLTPPYPPLALALRQDREDLDGDGAFDVFEDLNRNRILDPGEDRDGDGRLTPPFVNSPFGRFPGCEGPSREDQDCDGHLDLINEDLNGDGAWTLSEDLDGDRRFDNINEDLNGNGLLDFHDTNGNGVPDPGEPTEDGNRNGRLDGAGRYIEDRNNNRVFDDRPFPRPDDILFQVSLDGTMTRLPAEYPYASLTPAPGGVVVASVSWSGTAYDFDAVNTPARAITLDDGRQYRVIDAAPLDRLVPRVSGVRAGDAPRFGYRMRIEPLPLDRIDDVGGSRVIFERYEALLSSEFGTGEYFLETGPFTGGEVSFVSVPADGGFATIVSRFFEGFFYPQSSLVVLPVPLTFNIFSHEDGRAYARLQDIFDRDNDRLPLPYDICPDVAAPAFPGRHPDANLDGLGDACDPSYDPQALVDASWETRPDSDGPGARPGASAAYDAARGVTVLFGGSDDTATWEYDGTAWSGAQTRPAPPARSGHRMVYDGALGRILLFGGVTPEGVRPNDLWQYAGGTWSRIEAGISPPPSGQHPGLVADFALAYDAARRILVLFHATGQTWVFDGASWRNVPSPRSPLPRAGMEMAYDPFRQVTVLEGGYSEPLSPGEPPRFLNDTWEFDGRTWQQADTRGDLSPNWSGTMAYDAARRRIVDFGGVYLSALRSPSGPVVLLSPVSAATRLYDGTGWSYLPTRPTVAPQSDPAVAYDSRRQVLVVHGLSGPPEGVVGITAELRLPEDGDGDAVRDLRDNCPLRPNADQADFDHDGSGDACDNCPETDNPTQRDLDRDGAGDACDEDMDGDGVANRADACPAAYVAGRPFYEVLGGGGPDTDGDGAPDDCDLCPRDPRDDADHDGICGEADNCPATFNPHQENSTADGSGDACQPVLALAGVTQDGGEILEVSADARDPDGDPLGGSLDFFAQTRITLRSIDVNDPSTFCSADVYPPGRPGVGIVYAALPTGEAVMGDLDSAATCDDGQPDYLIARSSCAQAGPAFSTVISLFGVPVPICIGRYDPSFPGVVDPASLVDLTVVAFDQTAVHLALTETRPDLRLDFHDGLPPRSPLTGLVAGTFYRFLITVSDGSSVPVSAETILLYQGESIMAIRGRGPRAVISGEALVECDRPEGGAVRLDGSRSGDPEPGQGILTSEWYEDLGLPSERLLGTDSVLATVLPLGDHAISLRVTNAAGESDTAHTVVLVQDTAPPELLCPAPQTLECTGPDGAGAALEVRAVDACGGRRVRVETLRSDGADPTSPYPFGSTGVGVTATDPSGNSASCRTSVTVRDTVAPALSLTADPSVLWPPNHRLVPVQVSWRVRDACDPAPVVVLVAVSGNEPDDAVGDNDGRTETDVASAEAGTADGQILLRAERLGSGSGRQYELTYRAIDAHDNSASALVVVTVPHDLGSGPEPLILRFEGEATRTGTRLYWNTVPGATAYDVVMGDLSSRSFEGSRTVLRATRILAHETDLTSVAEPADAPGPAPGRAFFYLIQYLDGRGGSGYGTESALWPLEVLPVEAESASGGSDSEYLRR